jgi:DNA-directed RNA polymerase specialized sigma subunit
LKEAIDRTVKTLEVDYSDEEIEENFGEDDADWIEAFTEEFVISITSLMQFCIKCVNDCAERKKNLDDALTWGDFD